MVSIQQGHSRKSPFTIIAVVFLDETVRLHVSPQIRSVRKGSMTNFAFERLLARMRAIVALQQPRTRKRFATNFALTRKGMRADVHLQGAWCHIGFVTMLAFEHHLIVFI